MHCLGMTLGLLAQKRWHSKRLTWGAGEAVAIITWPALAGKWSLCIIAHSVLMASAWLALIYVFGQDRRGWVKTEKNQSSLLQANMLSVCLICRVLLWSGIYTTIWLSLCPKLSSECRTSSKGVERMETMNERRRKNQLHAHSGRPHIKCPSAFHVSLLKHCRCIM